MNTLVLIGLALVVAGCVLLVVRFAPRVRRQFAATAAQPRTVAELVRLRQQTGAMAVQPAARVATPPAARPEPPEPRVTPAAASIAAPVAAAPQPPPAPEPLAPAFVPPAPRPTPVAGRVRRESAEPPSARLDGDNAPWQRGARMAVGLGGGQPWREPPAPPAPLRVVPTASVDVEPAPEMPPEPEATVPAPVVPESRTDVPQEPDTSADEVPASPEPVPAEPVVQRQAVWVEPEMRREPAGSVPAEPPVAEPQAVRVEPAAVADVPREPVEPPAPDPAADGVAVSPEPVWIEPEAAAEVRREPAADASPEPIEPVPAEPVAQQQAVWIEPGAVAGAARSAEPAGPEPDEATPVPSGWDDTEAEDVPAGAVPTRFAEEERPDAPEARRRDRQTPDEKAAEQAAADLALLRTFGFADAGLRPDSAPVVAMEHPEEPETHVEAGAAQPVRYRVVRRDGTVVGGATVTLLDDRGGDVAAGAADADGRGEVLAPSPGGYVLVSTAAGHQPGAVAITVTGSAAETDVLIARSASVSGFVHGEAGPIAGARVTLVQDGEAVDAVDTDAAGTYRIGDIGAGEYGLSVAAPGCEPVAALLEVADEADVRHDVELAPASPVAGGDPAADDVMSGGLR